MVMMKAVKAVALCQNTNHKTLQYPGSLWEGERCEVCTGVKSACGLWPPAHTVFDLSRRPLPAGDEWVPDVYMSAPAAAGSTSNTTAPAMSCRESTTCLSSAGGRSRLCMVRVYCTCACNLFMVPGCLALLGHVVVLPALYGPPTLSHVVVLPPLYGPPTLSHVVVIPALYGPPTLSHSPLVSVVYYLVLALIFPPPLPFYWPAKHALYNWLPICTP